MVTMIIGMIKFHDLIYYWLDCHNIQLIHKWEVKGVVYKSWQVEEKAANELQQKEVEQAANESQQKVVEEAENESQQKEVE